MACKVSKNKKNWPKNDVNFADVSGFVLPNLRQFNAKKCTFSFSPKIVLGKDFSVLFSVFES